MNDFRKSGTLAEVGENLVVAFLCCFVLHTVLGLGLFATIVLAVLALHIVR